MTYNEDIAEVEPRSQEEFLDLMLEDGSEYWGKDITERDGTAIHRLYEPYAGRLAELERELRAVHQALRARTAEGTELDYIGEKYGISRREASTATGSIKFSRDTDATKDYFIQSGTVIKTQKPDQISFETTEGVTLTSGTRSVTASIEAKEAGAKGNVAANTITESVSGIVGVDTITNPSQMSGGRDREKDASYRERILTKVGEIEVTSGKNIFEELTSFNYVQEVKYIDNSEDTSGSGLNAHEVELVVDAEPGHENEIAQTIFDNLAMGANLVSGAHGTAQTGTATLSNGQSYTIDYSIPSETTIYVDVDVTLETNVEDADIKNAIVEYIGGTKTNGEQIRGELNVGDDVLYGEVDFSVRDIPEVYDVTLLEIGTSSSPTGTSNISITSTSRAVLSASNITLTKNVQ